MSPRVAAIAFAAVLAAAAPAPAQDRLTDLERKIDALSHEVERLKLGEAAEPTAEAAAPGQAPAATKVYRSAERKVSIGGYGEMTLQHFARRNQMGDTAGKRDELDFARAVLYAGYKFNDWVLFNSELEFEHGSTGKGRGEVSVEQAYLDFTPWGRALGLRAGLLIVPVGLVNEVHEPTTFHGVLRPAVERNLIPTTWRENGAGVFGQAGPVSYRSYVVTGLQATSNAGVTGIGGSTPLRNGRSSGAKSFAEDAAWVSRVDVSPIDGVLAGGSLYIGEMDHNFTAAAVPLTLWDLHAQLEYRGAELKWLYTEGTIGNPDSVNTANGIARTAATTTGVGRKLFGGYVEGAYNVLALCPRSKGQYLASFLRYERYDTQAEVPAGWFADPANSRVEYTAGLTYKPIPQVAVKGDYQWLQNQARKGVNQLNLGVGYIF
ncbi:MAG: hypothetical protein HY554_12095 [Elusimicrobia bacterium]|nr:hypothetical protein [Elusimicrobiota bacterium]